jgi:mannose-1-phosphate guanylyltransferase
VSDVDAVILVGGLGTRLRPLTLSAPKPMLPTAGVPFLTHLITRIQAAGVTHVVLGTSYRAEVFEKHFGDGSALGVELEYVLEPEPLGTGGGIRNAADLTSGTVWVLNGDVLTDADLSAMRTFHEARGSRTTIFLMPVPDPRQYGLVETAADGRLQRFREKPGPGEPIETNMINAGVYLIDAALLARVPPRQVVSVERDVFPALIADGVPCYGWTGEAYWRDIGSPAAYHAAQLDLLAGQVKTPLPPPGELRDGCWIEPSAFVATGAQLEAPAVIGAEAAVQAGARVGPLTVLGEHARIAAGAHVEAAVLWERVEVGAGSVLRECVIGADVRIGADVDIAPGVILESGAIVPDHARLTARAR